jgi:hypothetical protein
VLAALSWAALGLAVAACAAGAASQAGDVALTLTTVVLAPSATLVVKGRVCGARPPVRLQLTETRETYPVRLVLDAHVAGAPAPGCRAFQTSLSLPTLPPFAESCRERCLIEVRTPSGDARTLEYFPPRGT